MNDTGITHEQNLTWVTPSSCKALANGLVESRLLPVLPIGWVTPLSLQQLFYGLHSQHHSYRLHQAIPKLAQVTPPLPLVSFFVVGGSRRATIALSAGVGGPRRARRAAVARLKMQAQVLADCKVGAAHSLAVLASAFACMASTDTSASASTSTSAISSSCLVRWVGAAGVAAVAAVAIAADGCIFLRE